MFPVGPTFFSNAAAGDHPPGDGLTRLQVAFAGASSADVSSYLIGSGVNDEMTLSDGFASALFDSNANPKSLIYTDAGLAQQLSTSQLTYEIFWTATLDTPSPQSPGDAIKFAQFTTHDVGLDFYIRAYPNDADILVIQADYTSATVVGAHTYGALNHTAYVNRSTGGRDVYINGVRVIENRTGKPLVGVGTMQLGGIGRGDTRIKYLGARVRRAEMYTGASFAMPSGPSAWGAP